MVHTLLDATRDRAWRAFVKHMHHDSRSAHPPWTVDATAASDFDQAVDQISADAFACQSSRTMKAESAWLVARSTYRPTVTNRQESKV